MNWIFVSIYCDVVTVRFWQLESATPKEDHNFFQDGEQVLGCGEFFGVVFDHRWASSHYPFSSGTGLAGFCIQTGPATIASPPTRMQNSWRIFVHFFYFDVDENTSAGHILELNNMTTMFRRVYKKRLVVLSGLFVLQMFS